MPRKPAAHGRQEEARQFTEPGHALTGDRSKRSRRVGWEYVHSIVDDCSRLAYSEIHDDEKAPTVTGFTRRALDWFAEHGIVAERLMSDNAFTYVHNKALRQLLHARAIDHLRTRPYTPRTNGKVERLPANPATRVGLRPAIRVKRRPPRLADTLDQPLQRAAHPQRSQQPPTHRTRSGGHRAQHLARTHTGSGKAASLSCREPALGSLLTTVDVVYRGRGPACFKGLVPFQHRPNWALLRGDSLGCAAVFMARGDPRCRRK